MSLKTVSTFPERLKEALGEGSTTELAMTVGMSKQSISAYVNGSRNPKRPTTKALSEALNVNEMWLMGYNVPKERSCQQSLSSKSNLSDPIEEKYGKSVADAIQLYLQLDSDDQGEIRGEMKQMLKAEKYSVQEELKNA